MWLVWLYSVTWAIGLSTDRAFLTLHEEILLHCSTRIASSSFYTKTLERTRPIPTLLIAVNCETDRTYAGASQPSPQNKPALPRILQTNNSCPSLLLQIQPTITCTLHGIQNGDLSQSQLPTRFPPNLKYSSAFWTTYTTTSPVPSFVGLGLPEAGITCLRTSSWIHQGSTRSQAFRCGLCTLGDARSDFPSSPDEFPVSGVSESLSLQHMAGIKIVKWIMGRRAPLPPLNRVCSHAHDAEVAVAYKSFVKSLECVYLTQDV